MCDVRHEKLARLERKQMQLAGQGRARLRLLLRRAARPPDAQGLQAVHSPSGTRRSCWSGWKLRSPGSLATIAKDSTNEVERLKAQAIRLHDRHGVGSSTTSRQRMGKSPGRARHMPL